MLKSLLNIINQLNEVTNKVIDRINNENYS